MNIKLIKDYYGLDPVVRETLNYISKNIHESFNIDNDTKWIIGKTDKDVRKRLLEIDGVSRKRIILKLLLSEQIYSLIEIMQCVNTGIIKATHLLMRNIYECIIHIETFILYDHNNNIFKKWVSAEIDERWRHKKELEYMEELSGDKKTTKFKKEIYKILCGFAHPTMDSNIKVLSKDRFSGVYKVDRNYLYMILMLVIKGCILIYSTWHSEKRDIINQLNKFTIDIDELMRQNYLKRKQKKNKSTN